MIHVVGDRRNTGFCMKCGTELMVPWNDYQCCAKCTEKIESIVRCTKNRQGKVKKVRKQVVKSNAVMRQTKPIGGIPQ